MQMVGELKARTTGCLLAYSVRTGTRTHGCSPVPNCLSILFNSIKGGSRGGGGGGGGLGGL